MTERKKAQQKQQIDRTHIIDTNFIEAVSQQQFPPARSTATPETVGLDKAALLSLMDSQIKSRCLDLKARALRLEGKAFYTIGSCGHEGNAALALAFRLNDTALLHYRSAAFMLQRAKLLPDKDILHDMLLSFMASQDEPMSGGRHKVLGSKELFIPPQISTIASHLPKAVGLASSIERARLLKTDSELTGDSVVLCVFGDASANHSTAQGAFNTIRWMLHQCHPLPLVMVCEDNGLGISVPTPQSWIESQFAQRPEIEYIAADGLSVCDVYRASREAERIARVERRPVFLHIKCVRLLGHVGTDFEIQYREQSAIETDEANDPLLHTARILIENGFATPDEIIKHYQKIQRDIAKKAEAILKKYKPLSSKKAIEASIIPPKKYNTCPASPIIEQPNRPINLAQSINLALHEIMQQYANTLIFGEDVGVKGGMYQVTAGLQKIFGQARVFDTLLDEQTILGYAIGHAQNGFIPIPEIQYLAYLHNAEDQLRAEAATTSFFSQGQCANPMLVRIPSFASASGIGGHFHNENSIAFLRDIPGIIVACPSRGDDAVMMLRECIRLVYEDQRIVVFLELTSLYMTKDLYAEGDGLCLSEYPSQKQGIKYGELRVTGKSKQLVILTYGNAHHLSLQAAKQLKANHNIDIKVIDLRWLAPLNGKAILKAIKDCQQVLVVDPCRKTASISEELMTLIQENLTQPPIVKRITAEDCFVPIGKAAQYVLPSIKSIISKVVGMLRGRG